MNEFFICNLTLMTFLFTDYCTDGALKYQVGWGYIAFLASIEIITILFIFKNILNTAWLVSVKVTRIVIHKIKRRFESESDEF